MFDKRAQENKPLQVNFPNGNNMENTLQVNFPNGNNREHQGSTCQKICSKQIAALLIIKLCTAIKLTTSSTASTKMFADNFKRSMCFKPHNEQLVSKLVNSKTASNALSPGRLRKHASCWCTPNSCALDLRETDMYLTFSKFVFVKSPV